MSVQDDKRELEIIALLGLSKPDEGRSGTDASHAFESNGSPIVVPIELKSTTGETISTARDVGRDHIQKWRSRYWIIGFYDPTGKTLKSLLPLSPIEMEPWIKSIEDYILPDFVLGDLAYNKIGRDDMILLCEDKPTYGMEDARRIQKRQWNTDQYLSEMDVPGGYSPSKMLRIVKERTRYLVERGATLNNPHITTSFLAGYASRQVDATLLQSSLKDRNEFLRTVESDWLRHLNSK